MASQYQLIVNVLPSPTPENPKPPVEVKFLDASSKGEILKFIKNQLAEEMLDLPFKKTFVVLAEPVDKFAEKSAASSLTTLAEWLEDKRIEVTEKAKHALANHATKIYKDHYNIAPRRVTRQSPNGAWNKKLYAFEPDELWVIEKALPKVPYTVNPV